jgi:hypothetical protein
MQIKQTPRAKAVGIEVFGDFALRTTVLLAVDVPEKQDDRVSVRRSTTANEYSVADIETVVVDDHASTGTETAAAPVSSGAVLIPKNADVNATTMMEWLVDLVGDDFGGAKLKTNVRPHWRRRLNHLSHCHYR